MELSVGTPSSKLYSFGGRLRLTAVNFREIGQTSQPGRTLERTRTFLSKQSTKSQGGFGLPVNREIQGEDRCHQDYNVSIQQFLWRGATLVNTAWVKGVVVYPGHMSRIFRNTKHRRPKYSKLMKNYNVNAFTLFSMQVRKPQ